MLHMLIPHSFEIVRRERRVCRALCIAMLLLSTVISSCSILTSPAVLRPNFETRTEALRAGEYKLDPAHSFLLFKIGHLELATYVGRFNRFDASLEFDPENPSESRLDAIVYLDSLDVNDDDLEENLSDADWLNSQNFPEARFTTTRIEVAELSATQSEAESEEAARTTLQIFGDLEFRGITQPMVLEGRLNGGADNLLTGNYTLGFRASGRFSRSSFGMTAFPGLIGDIAELEIFAEFQRTTP